MVETAWEMRDLRTEEVPSEAVLSTLVARAAKWHRGENSTGNGALEHGGMNMIEKRAVETVHSNAIVVVFGGGSSGTVPGADP